MSATNIKYPPAAHTHHDESAVKPAVTSSQPRASATMAVGSNSDQARVGKAERIRGGCVPCPVCVEFCLCIAHLLTGPARMEACVGSSRYHAAVAKKMLLPWLISIGSPSTGFQMFYCKKDCNKDNLYIIRTVQVTSR